APHRADRALAHAEEPAALGADAALVDIADPIDLAVLAIDNDQLARLGDCIDHVPGHPGCVDAGQRQLPGRLAGAHVHGADEARVADRIDDAAADGRTP